MQQEMSTFAALRTLHSLIGDALTDIERVFDDYNSASFLSFPDLSPKSSNSSSSPPNSPGRDSSSATNFKSDPLLDFPSLDDPYDPASPVEALLSSPAVVRATKLIVASTGQLSAIVQRPFLTICDASMGVRLSVILS
jgi:hypothetical protein